MLHIEVSYEYDLLREAASLLVWKAGKDDKRFDPIFTDDPSHAASTPEFTQNARLLRETVDALFERLSLTPEDLALLTADISPSEDAMDTSLLIPFLVGSPLGYDQVLRRVRAMSEEDMRAVLFSYDAEDEGSAEAPDAWENRDVRVFTRNVLGHPDWSAEQKCHILSVYNEYHQNFERAAALLARCMEALEPLLPRLDPLLEKYRQSMEKRACDGCPELLTSTVALLDMNGAKARPFLSHPKALTAHFRLHEAGGQTPLEALFPGLNRRTLYVGLYCPYAPRELMSTEPNVAAQDLPDLLKALGDKSKFDILRILSVTPCYSAQLAQQLSLSPATISHHMSVLLNHGLVTLSERDGRFYYLPNKARLSAVLRTAQSLLLPQPPAP